MVKNISVGNYVDHENTYHQQLRTQANGKIIAGFSSLPFNCDDSALKLLLFTTFATRKTLS